MIRKLLFVENFERTEKFFLVRLFPIGRCFADLGEVDELSKEEIEAGQDADRD